MSATANSRTRRSIAADIIVGAVSRTVRCLLRSQTVRKSLAILLFVPAFFSLALPNLALAADPPVQFDRGPQAPFEGNPLVVRISRVGSTSERLVVNWETLEPLTTGAVDFATPVDDFVANNGTLTFEPGDRSSKEISIATITDTAYEPLEFIRIRLHGTHQSETFDFTNVKGTGSRLSDYGDAFIQEKDPRTVEITPKTSSDKLEFNEGNPGSLTVTLNNELPYDLKISYFADDARHRSATQMTGDGNSKMADFNVGITTDKNSILIAKGFTTGSINFSGHIINDSVAEPAEKFAMTFQTDPVLPAGSHSRYKAVQFRSDGNYSGSRAYKGFEVTIVDDDTSTKPVIYLHGSDRLQTSFSLNLNRRDDTSIPSTQVELNEGQTHTITATLAGGTVGSAVDIPLKFTGYPSSEATASDYTMSKTITIPANQTSGSAVLTINDDDKDERQKELLAIEVNGSHSNFPSSVTKGDRSRFEVIMIDNDPTDLVFKPFNRSPAEIFEKQDSQNRQLNFSVEVSRAPFSEPGGTKPFTYGQLREGNIRFDLNFGNAGKESRQARSDVDFEASPKFRNISSGGFQNFCRPVSGKPTCAFTLTAKDDNIYETDEKVKISLSHSGGTNLRVKGSNELIFTVKDDELQPKFSINDVAETEGGKLTFAVTRAGAAGNRISVKASTANSTGDNLATVGDDYSSASRELTFAPNVTSQNFEVQTNQDIIDEPNETFLVNLTEPKSKDGNPAPAVDDGKATGTINDDDDAPDALTISVDTDTETDPAESDISEDAGETTVKVTATITSATRFATEKKVNVKIGNSDDSAVEGTDYGTVADIEITIPAGEASGSMDVMLTPTNDDIDEPDKTISVEGTLADVTVTHAKLNLIDDEVKPTVTLELAADSISEAGGTTTVKGTLSGKSSEAVTLTLAAVEEAYTLSGTALTIPAGEKESSPVTITATNNHVDADNNEVSVSAMASGGNDVEDPDDQTLTITDDDVRGVTVSKATVSIKEIDDAETNDKEHQDTYTVKLNSEPSKGTVTVKVGSKHPLVATVDKASLEFTKENWSTAQMVTITAVDDDVYHADDQRTTSITHTIIASGNDYADKNLEVAPVAVTVTGNETKPVATLVLNPTSIGEKGGSTTVTATLSGKSSEAVVLKVSAAAGTGAVARDFSLSDDTELKIAAGATASTGTVTITAVDNSIDTDNKPVTVSATATGGNGVAAPADQTLTLTDDDVRGVTVSKATVSMKEIDDAETDDKEHQDTYTVKLNSEPTGTVTVNVASGTASVATVDKTSLSFTTSNWSTPQVVTVTAKDDIIDNTGDERTTNITHTVVAGTSDYGGVTASPVAVTVEDEDVAPSALEITVDADSKTGGNQTEISEGSDATTVTVTATITSATRFAMAKMVTVTVGKSGDSATEGTDYGNVANVSITILKGAVSGSKDITLTPTNDTIDEPDETISVEGTLAGVTVTHAQLTLKDDDATPTVTLELGSASIGENAQTTTVKGKLSGASSQAVTLEFSALANVYTLSGTTLTIAAGSVESTGTLTITAVDNQVDAANRVVSISATVTGGNGVEAPASKTLTITDDDVRGVTVTGSPLTVNEVDNTGTTDENEHQATYTVKLNTEPTGTVTVNVASDATSVATVNKASLEFTTANWKTTQTVTVTAKDDDRDNTGNKRTTSITHTISATGTDYADSNLTVDSVAVTVNDDEVLPVVSLSLGSSSIGEKGGSTTVTATMVGKSDKNVVLTVSAAAGTGAVAGDFTLTGTTLTIAAGSQVSTGTVTIAAVDNDVDTANKTVTVSATASGGNGVAAPEDQTLTITDDDVRGVNISEDTVTVDEADNTGTTEKNEHKATYSVVLDSQPTGTVTINVASSATSVATVDKANLSFTTSTWSKPQTVTITAKDDAIDNTGDKRTTSITHTVSASSTDYKDETAASVSVTVTDNDGLPVVSLVLTSASIGEKGGSTTVTATMNGTSSQNVALTVSAAAGTGAVAGDFTLTGSTLTIAAGTQVSTGTVTIAAVDNDVDTANKTVTVSATASGGNGVADPGDQTLTITDDDERGVTVTGSPLTIVEVDDSTSDDDEEHKDTYTVVLDTKPTTGTVTVSVASKHPLVATVDKSSLSFTTSNWNEAQTVTITAKDDAIDNTGNKRTTSITHTISASGNDYAVEGLEVDPVAVTVNDNEGTPVVSLVLTPSSIDEDGGSTTVTATMSGQSSEEVVLTVSAAASTGAVANDFDLSDDVTLTIAAGETASTGAVTITAKENSIDTANKSVTVSATATGGNGVVAPGDQTLTLTDDDVRGVTVSKATVSMKEIDDAETTNDKEHQDTYTVKLNSEPTGTVTVNVVSGAASVATVDKPSLSFTTSNWSTPQVVTVTAKDDIIDNTGNKRTTNITHTVVAGTSDYGGVTASAVAVTVDDEDVAPSALEITVDTDSTTDGNQTEISEGGSAATVTVTATITSATRFATNKTVTVTVGKAGDSATEGTDYGNVANVSITILKGAVSGSKDITLTPTNDTIDEPDETISVEGTLTGVTVTHAQLTLKDDDATPTVTLELGSASIGENAQTTTVKGKLSGASSQAVTLEFSALANVYTLSGTTLTIAAGSVESTGTLTITAVDNQVDAANRVVSISATVTGGNGVEAPASKTLTITDDDVRGVTVTGSPVTIEEVDKAGTDQKENQATYTVKLNSQPSTGTVTVNVASRATSVATVNKESLEFTKTNWRTAQTVTVTAIDDNIDNTGNKRTTNITHTVSASGTDYVDETAGSVAITVNDDDDAPNSMRITVDTDSNSSGNQNSIRENASATSVEVTVTITDSTRFAIAKTVDISVGKPGDSAVEGTDYFAVSDFSMEVPAEKVSASKNFNLRPKNDVVDEPREEISVEGELTGVTVAPAKIRLTDNDRRPKVTLELSKARINEKNGSATVKATLSGASSEDVTLTFAPLANVYTLSGTTLTIPAGSVESTGTLAVTAVDNNVDAPNNKVSLSATVAGGNGVAPPLPKSLTIVDDDRRGVTISESAVTIEEVDDSETPNLIEHKATYTVVLDSEPTGTVTVNVASGASKVATVDETSLEFTTENWNVARTVTITAGDDDVDNTSGRRTTSITHSVSATGTDYAKVTASSVAVRVNDNETLPVVSLVLAPASIGENGGSTTVTATLSGKSSKDVNLTLAAVAGTGTVAGDFNLQGNKLTIAKGTTGSTGEVTIVAENNDVDTPNKTVTVSATASGGNGVANPVNQTLTITDDDDRGVTISESEVTIEEVDDTRTDSDQEHKATYTVVLDSEPTTGTVTVNVASGATAVATVDKASLIFTKATWDTAQTVTITAKDDAIDNTGNKRSTSITHAVDATTGSDYENQGNYIDECRRALVYYSALIY